MGFESPKFDQQPTEEKTVSEKTKEGKESQAEKMTEEEFKEGSTAIVEDIMVTNIKDPDFNLNNPKDKLWLEGIMGAKKMLEDGNYKEPKFFAGPDGLRAPEWHETPEGIIRERLQRHEEVIRGTKKEYPDNWGEYVPESALEDIKYCKNLLNFLEESSEDTKSQREQNQKTEKAKETKENLENEELFKQQIENMAHPEAKDLISDTALFLNNLDNFSMDAMEFYKADLDGILDRRDIEYEKEKEIKIPEKDKALLEPFVKFRQELDEWNTFTESRVADYRQRIFSYLKETFGIEEIGASVGEKFNGKEQKAIGIEETDDPTLEKIIKIARPGYKINKQLYGYYEKYIQEETNKRGEKLNIAKESASREEFDKMYEEYASWKKAHMFPQQIKPAEVVIYKYNPEK